MKRCLTCNTTFASSKFLCPACGARPKMQEGFVTYAPALAQEGSGFKPSYFSELAIHEENHFWFCVRNRLIVWALGKYCKQFSSFLEIGCGTGYVLSEIAKNYPSAQIYGSEIFIAGLMFAVIRQQTSNLMQMDARNIPFVEEFDIIGAFDVLEHIQEDEQVLIQIYRALKPCGVIVLTVPQHPWLWSSFDDYVCHKRRYTTKELHAKIKAAGFKILRSTSFVSSLLPAMVISRIVKKQTSNAYIAANLRISPWINWLCEKILNIEFAMIRFGVNLPIGGSRLIIAVKQE